jgi:hypothetical protein
VRHPEEVTHVERPDSVDAVQVLWHVADRRLHGEVRNRAICPSLPSTNAERFSLRTA